MVKAGRSSLERSLVGPAGEHYVLYKLHAKGLLGTHAPRNAPTVDVLVLNPDESVAASIQVKTRTYGKDQGWHMSTKHESIIQDRLFYAFVDMEPAEPVCYVVPSKVVAAAVAKSYAAWLATPGKNGKKHNATDMRRIRPAYEFDVKGFAPGWMEPYREAWHLLKSPEA